MIRLFYSEIASSQKTLQPGHDSGWNDPPWSATAGSPKPPGAQKRLLNKRVGFPINSTMEKINSDENQYIPSSKANFAYTSTTNSYTTTPHKTSNKPPLVEEDESNSAILIDRDGSLKSSLENLKFALNKLDSNKSSDIQKKFNIMETMWKEDKLDRNVHKKVLELSEGTLLYEQKLQREVEDEF